MPCKRAPRMCVSVLEYDVRSANRFWLVIRNWIESVPLVLNKQKSSAEYVMNVWCGCCCCCCVNCSIAFHIFCILSASKAEIHYAVNSINLWFDHAYRKRGHESNSEKFWKFHNGFCALRRQIYILLAYSCEASRPFLLWECSEKEEKWAVYLCKLISSLATCLWRNFYHPRLVTICLI